MEEDKLLILKSVAASLGLLVVKVDEVRSLLDDFNEQFYHATQQKQVKSDKNTFTGVKVDKDPNPDEQPGIYMQTDEDFAFLEALEKRKGRQGPEVTLDDPLDPDDLHEEEAQ